MMFTSSHPDAMVRRAYVLDKSIEWCRKHYYDFDEEALPAMLEALHRGEVELRLIQGILADKGTPYISAQDKAAASEQARKERDEAYSKRIQQQWAEAKERRMAARTQPAPDKNPSKIEVAADAAKKEAQRNLKRPKKAAAEKPERSTPSMPTSQDSWAAFWIVRPVLSLRRGLAQMQPVDSSRRRYVKRMPEACSGFFHPDFLHGY